MTKQQKEIIASVVTILQRRYQDDSSGHDWLHLERVWKMVKKLAKSEHVDQFVLEMAALLHDVDDYKVKKDEEAEFSRTEAILAPFQLSDGFKKQLFDVIGEVSFKGAGVNTTPTSLEGKIVQDADRLDAMGAIGIARTFMYNGHKGQPMHNPDILPRAGDSFKTYKSAKSTAINHFYEKLLLIQDRLNTPEAKKIGERRHRVLEEYLKEFFAEMEGRA